MALTYRICPKCGHERTVNDTAPEGVCAACGLVFAKYLQSRLAGSARLQTRDPHRPFEIDELSLGARAKALLLHVPKKSTPCMFTRG